MSFSVVMDRPFKKGVHYVSPGGYELEFPGTFYNPVNFDFCHAEYMINARNPRVLHYTVSGWDMGCASCSKELFAMIMKQVSADAQFSEFFVYTGKRGDAEIRAVEIYDIKLDIDGQIYEFGDFLLDKDGLSAVSFEYILLNLVFGPEHAEPDADASRIFAAQVLVNAAQFDEEALNDCFSSYFETAEVAGFYNEVAEECLQSMDWEFQMVNGGAIPACTQVVTMYI